MDMPPMPETEYPYNELREHKKTILYAIALVEWLMKKAKNNQMFIWAANQKKELEETYDKFNR